MPRRSKKILNNKKAINSSISRADRSIQLNRNACDQTQNHGTNHLESIGNLIIDELKGSERDHLKQQLLTSCVSTTTIISNLPFSSSRRSLKQILADLHTFNRLNQRQYRTIGIGDNDVNVNLSTTNINKLDITTQQTKNANMLNNESEVPTVPKRRTRRTSFGNSSQTIDNEIKKTPNIITRTVCTRSSKLNTLNNNQEQMNYILRNRGHKRRLNDTNTQTQINNADNTTNQPDLNAHKPIGEDVSGVKISRKKLQSSVPCSTTVECLNTTNDF